MRQFLLTGMLIAFSMSLLGAQQETNAPTKITNVTQYGVKVRYLDFKWDEEAFGALEKGGDAPAAQRSWAIARLFPSKPIIVDGKRIADGNLLILHPARGDKPMMFEVRAIDMRVFFKETNVIAEPPAEGKTLHVEPADFKKVDTVADRMTMSLSEGDGSIKLSIHYGNRMAVMEFAR
jgi:hypothetical protein